ncbi:transcriptional regulator TACO1-like protein [Xylogone sp. PMI_703]|nr:transcriptional regulator TACO1-like protein [Xylogone sp. PMI_703]
MAAFSRGVRALAHQWEYSYIQCLSFSTTSVAQSGHNRWSKIKHDKMGVDAKKNQQRSMFAHEIALASKLHGGDPNTNPRLATVLATAKKAGFPKASMEAAIARGQGRSTSGAALENLTLEVMMPSQVAIVIDIETDNRARSLMELRFIVKCHGGTVSPTSYLFTKKGRVSFEKDERNLGVDEVLDEAIEAGAEDVETDEDGNIVVWTEPQSTTAAAQGLMKSLALKIQSSEIIWDANEDTMVKLDSPEAVQALSDFIDQLQENDSVQGVYANIAQGNIEDDVWESLQSKLAA